jgi:outer membrane protein, multidrug efflux system
MNAFKIFAGALLSAMVAGCNLAPVYQRPASPVSAAWPTGAAYPAVERGSAALAGWESFYLDPSLRRLIRLGLDNNRDLRQVALNAEAYRALHRIQHAATLPDVALNASEQRQRVPGDLSPSGQSQVQSQYAIEAGASYELDFFGKVKNLDRASLQLYLASDEARQSASIALVGSIADAYLTLRTDEALAELVDATLQSYQHSLRLVESNQQAGLVSSLAVRQARTLVLQAQTQQTSYVRQVAQDLNALERLVGAPLPSDMPRPANLATAIASDVPVGLPSDLLLRRPDIRAAEHVLQAADANIGAARAAFFPSIQLTAGAGTASASLDGLLGAGSGAWHFMPTVSLPIFNAGRLKANEAYADIKQQSAVASYEAAIQQAFREVADGLAARGTYTLQLSTQESDARNANEYVALSQARFKQGLDGYLVVLDAQRTLFGAQQHLLASRREQLSAEVGLFRAMGGGWDADSGYSFSSLQSDMKHERP